MGNGLTYTSGAFIQCTTSTASRAGGTIYEILSATTSVARKVYGINVVNADNAANPVRVWLSDGSTRVQVSNVNVPANAGNNVTTGATNVYGSSIGGAALHKTRDMNGVPYLTIPIGWKIELSYTNTPIAAEFLTTIVYGEYY